MKGTIKTKEGKTVDLNKIYSIGLAVCGKSKHSYEKEDFACWCVMKAIEKANAGGKNAHLNNINWLFSEWLFVFFREGSKYVGTKRKFVPLENIKEFYTPDI